MPASHREAELPQEDSSRGQDHARWAVHLKALIMQIINSCIILKHCFILFTCTLYQPAPIAELDGTVSGDFFTVLCVGQGFTDDQWMNVYSFSMLRHWLLTYHSISNSNSTADTGTTSHRFEPLSCLKGSSLHFRAMNHKERNVSLNLNFTWAFFRWTNLSFHHLQQTGCSSASPSPSPTHFLMVRHVSLWDFCMTLHRSVWARH